MRESIEAHNKEIFECQVSNKCGGCSFAGKTYKETLGHKQFYIERLLRDFNVKVNSIIGDDEPFYYRNKVHAAFATLKGGKVISGTYEEGTHKIVNSDCCLLQNREATAIIATIRKLAQEFKMPIYNEDTHKGLLRRVLIRTADSRGEILVVLVMADSLFPGKKNFISKLRKAHPSITSVVINVNKRTDSMILGDKSETAFGSGFIIDELCGLKFKLSPESFYQINHDQCERLYAKAIEYAALDKNSKVLDAYCGIGTIGLIASKEAGIVNAVELNKIAVRDAIGNAKANGITNTHFVSADATEYILKEASRGEKYDVIFLDPPRSGTTPEFIEACKKLAPKRIVYVSCGPESLARDLKLFDKAGYKIQEATPVDMFPWTEHVETVVQLSKGSIPSQDVKVKFSMENISSAQYLDKPATYEQIKSYVKEHSGLNVSSLYIAQVKQKYGIIERDCYNRPKSENSRQPKCTVEKENAIVDALKYFKMI